MWGTILWSEADVATYTDALYSESCMKVSVMDSTICQMEISTQKRYHMSIVE